MAKANRLPVMPRVIITVPEKTAQPYRFKLEREIVSIGRGSDNDIVIDSGSVSGKHAEMRRVDGGYELVDLGSTNGIKYDESRQDKISLRSGMSAKLGDVTFDFTLSEEELVALGHEESPDESPASKEPEKVAPAKKERKKTESKPAPRKQTGFLLAMVGELGMILLFLFLAGGAFVVGLVVRHQKDTGEFLFNEIANKVEIEKVDSPAADE